MSLSTDADSLHSLEKEKVEIKEKHGNLHTERSLDSAPTNTVVATLSTRHPATTIQNMNSGELFQWGIDPFDRENQGLDFGVNDWFLPHVRSSESDHTHSDTSRSPSVVMNAMESSSSVYAHDEIVCKGAVSSVPDYLSSTQRNNLPLNSIGVDLVTEVSKSDMVETD